VVSNSPQCEVYGRVSAQATNNELTEGARELRSDGVVLAERVRRLTDQCVPRNLLEVATCWRRLTADTFRLAYD
jgi:hypothetical protein